MRGDYSEIVRSRLDRILQDGGGGDLEKYRECQRALGQIIEDIQRDLQADPFQDNEEEIVFYKEQAPGIWGQHLLYEKLVKIEARRKFQSKDVFIAGLRQARQEAEAFLEKHGDICEYYYEGRTDADGRLFTRRGTHKSKNTTINLRIDRDFTIGAYYLSRVRAHELLRDWLKRELEGPPEAGRTKKLPWNATATATIELFKGLHLDGCFGDTSFKDIMDWVREYLEVDVANYNVVLQNTRDRKITPAKYLEKLSKAFKNFIDAKK